MSVPIAMACAICGGEVKRHPSMRGRRVVCFVCQETRRNDGSNRRREARKALEMKERELRAIIVSKVRKKSRRGSLDHGSLG